MSNLLLEIGSEEIPAGYIVPALNALSATLMQRLTDARIDHGSAEVYATPRRLALTCAWKSPGSMFPAAPSMAASSAVVWGHD